MGDNSIPLKRVRYVRRTPEQKRESYAKRSIKTAITRKRKAVERTRTCFANASSRQLAWMSGVLKGDGWCTNVIGLRSKDRDFAEAFANALSQYSGRSVIARVENRKDGRRYWVAKTGNRSGVFTPIKRFTPTTLFEKADWLRGLFDSEGNVSLHPHRSGANSFTRRVSLYSTRAATLRTAVVFLADLDIESRNIRATTNHASHIGRKVVFELAITSSKVNYQRFAELVGSTLKRKTLTLNAIPNSYVADLSATCRDNQLKGAATRTKRFEERYRFIILPRALVAIRDLISQGIKPTQRACYRAIPEFWAVRERVRQQELIDLARRTQ